MKQKVIILDFGSQYTQLIARRVREHAVYSEVHPYNLSAARLRQLNPAAVILSGGPSSVYGPGAPQVDPGVFNLKVPFLGICYGLQIIARHLGATIVPAPSREYGLARMEVVKDSGLLRGVSRETRVWMSHGDKLQDLPPDFVISGHTPNTEFAAIESPRRHLYGVQFHPEVIHTEDGKRILHNFLFHIAGLKGEWNMKDFIQTTLLELRRRIQDRRVILGLSGGVDSTVLAVLLHRAIGKQLIPVFVDTGLLRKNEFQDLMKRFKNDLDLNVRGIPAGDLFLDRLRGIRTPEKKRKIIGNTFIDVFREIEKEVGRVELFAQGTLYPDVIESVSVKGPSATIKSHHNVGGLPEEMNWQLVEPFRELFKDEVRKVGRELKVSPEVIRRHPFPGPGLSIRILGAISRRKIRILQEADAILIDELHRHDIYDDIWQAFMVLLPVRTVGVMGDERTYEYVAAIRLIESIDGMTADWHRAPYPFLNQVANRVVNNVRGINRVVYDITSKPPATIEWE